MADTLNATTETAENTQVNEYKNSENDQYKSNYDSTYDKKVAESMDRSKVSTSKLEDKPEVKVSLVDDASIQHCSFICLKLPFLERFKNMYMMILFLSIAGILQGMIVNGFVNVIASNAEKRFNYMSRHSGTIMAAYDVGSLLVVIPVTYGSDKHIPRWLGGGMLVQGIGSLIVASPHYLTNNYQFTATNSSGVCYKSRGEVCDNATMEGHHAVENDNKLGLSSYRFVMMIGQLLHGIGAAPMYTLSIVYLDNNLKQKLVAISIAIFYTCTIIGPGLGYIICGKMLEIYTDFDSVDTSTIGIDNTHPRWVGAWWLGFIVFGSMNILFSVPMSCFPKEMPGSVYLRASKVCEAYEDENIKKIEENNKEKTLVEHLTMSFIVLVNNPVFIFVSIAGAMEAILMIGYGSFAPKFIESQYSMTASEAATLTGIGVVPAGAGGLLIGGMISKYYDLSVLGQVKFCLITGGISSIFLFSFLIRCKNVELAGITIPTHITKNFVLHDTVLKYNVSDRCNSMCTCETDKFRPVCSRNGMTYYSACMAGCEFEKKIGDKKHYGKCSCIDNLEWSESVLSAYGSLSEEDKEFTEAINGFCPSVCSSFYLFIMLFGSFVFFGFMTFIPALNSTLRCLPDEHRSLGIGLQWMIVRVLGTIPAPIIFGMMLDWSCILSNTPRGNGCQDKSDFNDSKTCLYYENNKMSNYMMAIGLLIKVISLSLFALAYIKYKAYEDKKGKKNIFSKLNVSSDMKLNVVTSKSRLN